MKFLAILTVAVIALIVGGEMRTQISAENVERVTEIALWNGSSRVIADLDFTPEGDMLVLVSAAGFIDDGEIIFLNVESLEPTSLTTETIIGTRTAFSRDGTLFAVGTASGTLTVYEYPQLDEIMTIEETNSRILSLAIDPANRYVAVTFGSPATLMGGDTAFKVFTIASGEEYLALPCDIITDMGCEGPFGTAVAFDDVGETVFLSTTYGDNYIRSWDLGTREEALLGDDAAVLPGNLIYTEDWLAYITVDNQIQLLGFDGIIRILQDAETTINEFGQVNSIILHPAEPILVASYIYDVAQNSNRDAVIRFWNTDTGAVLKTILITSPEQDDPISALAFSPDGTLLASGGTDGTVRLWGIPADDD